MNSNIYTADQQTSAGDKTNKSLISWEEAVDKIKKDPAMNQLVINSYFDDPVFVAAERFYKSGEWKATRELIDSLSEFTDTAGRNLSALDIGAGRGIASYALSRDGWKVTALEPYKSETIGNIAIQKMIAGLDIKNITLACDYGENLKFDDKSFDLVYMRQALHHANDLEKFCAEAGRVLKQGGIFIAAREHIISRKSDLNKFLTNHPLHKYYGGENAHTTAEYTTAIKNAGIRLKKILKTYDSNINLFPETRESVAIKIYQKLKFKPPGFIIYAILKTLNLLNNTPGRLYTFAGIKR